MAGLLPLEAQSFKAFKVRALKMDFFHRLLAAKVLKKKLRARDTLNLNAHFRNKKEAWWKSRYEGRVLIEAKLKCLFSYTTTSLTSSLTWTPSNHLHWLRYQYFACSAWIGPSCTAKHLFFSRSIKWGRYLKTRDWLVRLRKKPRVHRDLRNKAAAR